MSSTIPCYRCKHQVYVLDGCRLECYKCKQYAHYCKECASVMTYYSNSQEQLVYQCYTCLKTPPKQISLMDIRHTIAENQGQPGHDDYILANPNHMDREGTLTTPNPLPTFSQLQDGVNDILYGITLLRDNMEHVFVTLQAMDSDLVQHITNSDNKFIIEHELMNIKQVLSRMYSVYAGLIEIKDPTITNPNPISSNNDNDEPTTNRS